MPNQAMHYAIRDFMHKSLPPKSGSPSHYALGAGMHYQLMHYEQVYCSRHIILAIYFPVSNYKMSEPPPVSYDHIPTQLIGTFLPPLSISIAALLKFNLMPFTDIYNFEVDTNKNRLSFSNSPNIDIKNSLL